MEGSIGSTIVCLAHRCDQSKIQIAFKGRNETCKNCSMQKTFKTTTDHVEFKYPFCDSSEVTNDIILVPSKGTFLGEFNNSTGLHIGIASGRAKILEFDQSGLHYDRQYKERWQQCLSLKFIHKLLVGTRIVNLKRAYSLWNSTIEQYLESHEQRWSPDFYNYDHNNCFHFVQDFTSRFIKLLYSDEYNVEEAINVTLKIKDGITFCENFVIPEMQSAVRYISLFKKLERATSASR